MHQLGISNVVASSGTSLTVNQIRLIKKFTDNITIMYDGDAAGIHAALRGIGLILKEGLNVKVVLIPDGDDPDSYARKHTLDEVKDFIDKNEQDFIAYKTALLKSQAGNDPLKIAELINDIADTIALIPDKIKQAVYVQNSAREFNIDEQMIFTRISETMHKIIEEERKEAERERRRAEAAAVSRARTARVEQHRRVMQEFLAEAMQGRQVVTADMMRPMSGGVQALLVPQAVQEGEQDLRPR